MKSFARGVNVRYIPSKSLWEEEYIVLAHKDGFTIREAKFYLALKHIKHHVMITVTAVELVI
jgi:hypothetical protein